MYISRFHAYNTVNIGKESGYTVRRMFSVLEKYDHSFADMKSNIRTLAALALVNNEVWDMHRPLNADCSLEFLKFMDSDPAELNKV